MGRAITRVGSSLAQLDEVIARIDRRLRLPLASTLDAGSARGCCGTHVNPHLVAAWDVVLAENLIHAGQGRCLAS
jgi:hypothetical protein